jgi:hypothetical protein
LRVEVPVAESSGASPIEIEPTLVVTHLQIPNSIPSSRQLRIEAVDCKIFIERDGGGTRHGAESMVGCNAYFTLMDQRILSLPASHFIAVAVVGAVDVPETAQNKKIVQ